MRPAEGAEDSCSLRLIGVTRFLAITTCLPEGAFKRGAERRAQGDPEADVMERGSHGNADGHADCDARTWC